MAELVVTTDPVDATIDPGGVVTISAAVTGLKDPFDSTVHLTEEPHGITADVVIHVRGESAGTISAAVADGDAGTVSGASPGPFTFQA